MLYRLLADAVVVLHLLFVLYVILGSLLVLKWPYTSWLHVPAALWGAIIELAAWRCPLTPLEQSLRRLAGQQGFAGGFIDHYIISVLYPPGLTRTHQILLGIVVIAINAVIYGYIWRRAMRADGGERSRR